MNNNNSYTSSSTSAHHYQSSDEFSVFVRQILNTSSSSSSSSSLSTSSLFPQMDSNVQSCRLPTVKEAIYVVDSSNGSNPSSSGYLTTTMANLASSSLGTSENEIDEFDCESEDGLEAFVEEFQAKPNPPRSSSKRSRAAEVHNLSEKRRRSRINEKMKALQNLIPNSNKTDKASMLDEAIEYLKQLQLQVQMLSLRNGVSLHPLCLPGMMNPLQLSQLRNDFGEEHGSIHMNGGPTSTRPIFNLSNHSTASNQSSVAVMTKYTNREPSFSLGSSSIQSRFEPFQLHTASEVLRGETVLPRPHLISDHCEANTSGLLKEIEILGGEPMRLSRFDSRTHDIKNNNVCLSSLGQSKGMLS